MEPTVAEPRALPAAASFLAFAGVSALASYLSKPRGAPFAAFRLASKPKWELPNAAMGPAWITGSALLGLSGWRAWQASRGTARGRTLGLWATYLVQNAATNLQGHGVGKTAWTDILGIVLLGAYATQVGKTSKLATWLVLPYIGWLAYTGVTSEAVRRKNPLLRRFF